MATQKEIVIKTVLANPEVLKQLEVVTKNRGAKLDVNLQLANPDVLKQLKDVGGKKTIDLAFNSGNLTDQLLKLETKFRELQQLAVLKINVSGNPEGTLRNIQLELAKQFKTELGAKGITNPYSVKSDVLDKALQEIKTELINAEKNKKEAAQAAAKAEKEVADLAKEEARLKKSNLQKLKQLQQEETAAFRLEANTNLANKQFREDERIPRLIGRLGNYLGVKNNLEDESLNRVAYQRGLLPNQITEKNLKLFDPRNLASKEAAQEVGLATLFGGTGAGAGAALGRGFLGAGGGAIGVAVAATVGKFLDTVLEPLKKAFEEGIESGHEYQKSIVSIAASAQTVTQIVGAGSIKEQVQGQEKRAEAIQITARRRLAPLGIGGTQESALVSAIVEAYASKGIELNPDQASEIAARFGSAANVLTPDLANDPSRTRRDVRDIILGSSGAGRTTLGTPLRKFLPGIAGAKTGEEAVSSVRGLKGFEDVLLNTDKVTIIEEQTKRIKAATEGTLGAIYLQNSVIVGLAKLDNMFSRQVNSFINNLAKLSGIDATQAPEAEGRPEILAEANFRKAGVDVEAIGKEAHQFTTTPEGRRKLFSEGVSQARRAETPDTLFASFLSEDSIIKQQYDAKRARTSVGGVAGELAGINTNAGELEDRKRTRFSNVKDIDDRIAKLDKTIEGATLQAKLQVYTPENKKGKTGEQLTKEVSDLSESTIKAATAEKEKLANVRLNTIQKLSEIFAEKIENAAKFIEASFKRVNQAFEGNTFQQNFDNLAKLTKTVNSTLSQVSKEIAEATKNGASPDTIAALKARAAELGLTIRDIVKKLRDNLDKLTSANDPASYVGKVEQSKVSGVKTYYDAVLNGVPLERARTLANSQIARDNVTRNVEDSTSRRQFRAFDEKKFDFLIELPHKFKELSDAVEQSKVALKNFAEDAENRRLGRENEVLGAAEAAKQAGASDEEIARYLPVGLGVDISSDEGKEYLKKKFALSNLKKSGRNLEQGEDTDRFEQNKLEIGSDRAQHSQETFGREVRNQSEDEDQKNVEYYLKFAGTKFGDSLKDKAKQALGRIQKSNKEQGIESPLGEGTPDELIEAIGKQASEQNKEIPSFNAGIQKAVDALAIFAPALEAANAALNALTQGAPETPGKEEIKEVEKINPKSGATFDIKNNILDNDAQGNSLFEVEKKEEKPKNQANEAIDAVSGLATTVGLSTGNYGLAALANILPGFIKDAFGTNKDTKTPAKEELKSIGSFPDYSPALDFAPFDAQLTKGPTNPKDSNKLLGANILAGLSGTSGPITSIKDSSEELRGQALLYDSFEPKIKTPNQAGVQKNIRSAAGSAFTPAENDPKTDKPNNEDLKAIRSIIENLGNIITNASKSAFN